jgi:carboxyl-terminal processing protease
MLLEMLLMAALALTLDHEPEAALPNGGEDLAKLYPAKRTSSQTGLFPVANAEDVWEVKSFEVGLVKDLELVCKRATVVLGHDGTDVLWAVVLPDKPPKITGALAFKGESAASIVLRFAPSEIGRIFPSATIAGRGDGWRRHEASRIARRKMVWDWCTPAGNPTIVPTPMTIVDVDTVEGPRRFWAIDRNAGKVTRVDDFTDKATPALTPIDSRAALQAFDEVWEAFDKEYATFVTLPSLDWETVGKRYRKQAGEVQSTFALAGVLADLLAHLEDLHVWVMCGEESLRGYTRDRPLNGNWKATRARLTEAKEAGREVVWGRTKEGLGYIGVHGLTDQELAMHVDAALESLRETKGLIVDLRFNGGGDELLARSFAGRFADEPVVYSKNRYRVGPKHDQLGPVLDRVLEPRGPWRYEAPVVCLFGQLTLSSAESLAAMFGECPNVTTMGAPTGGSSANPRRIELECGIKVNLPRWLDLLPDGTPIERHGVLPDVPLEHAPTAFTDSTDPVFEAALARLTK